MLSFFSLSVSIPASFHRSSSCLINRLSSLGLADWNLGASQDPGIIMDFSLTIAGKFLSVWDSGSSGSMSIPTPSVCFSAFSILLLKSLTCPDFLFLQLNSADPDARLRLLSNHGSLPAFREFFDNLGI